MRLLMDPTRRPKTKMQNKAQGTETYFINHLQELKLKLFPTSIFLKLFSNFKADFVEINFCGFVLYELHKIWFKQSSTCPAMHFTAVLQNFHMFPTYLVCATICICAGCLHDGFLMHISQYVSYGSIEWLFIWNNDHAWSYIFTDGAKQNLGKLFLYSINWKSTVEVETQPTSCLV